MAQELQPQPQEDFPVFLSFTVFTAIAAIIAKRMILIIIVPIFISLSFFTRCIFGLYPYTFSSFCASTYFLKKSIYIITAKTASAATKPKTLILPPKAFPN